MTLHAPAADEEEEEEEGESAVNGVTNHDLNHAPHDTGAGAASCPLPSTPPSLEGEEGEPECLCSRSLRRSSAVADEDDEEEDDSDDDEDEDDEEEALAPPDKIESTAWSMFILHLSSAEIAVCASQPLSSMR
jgi:hypothetical protein